MFFSKLLSNVVIMIKNRRHIAGYIGRQFIIIVIFSKIEVFLFNNDVLIFKYKFGFNAYVNVEDGKNYNKDLTYIGILDICYS